MHSGSILSIFGEYMPYATLIVAVIGLTYSSKKELARLKSEKEGVNGKKEKRTAQAAESD